jgi:hypothetical protein
LGDRSRAPISRVLPSLFPGFDRLGAEDSGGGLTVSGLLYFYDLDVDGSSSTFGDDTDSTAGILALFPAC